jgi:hypothetical protein
MPLKRLVEATSAAEVPREEYDSDFGNPPAFAPIAKYNAGGKIGRLYLEGSQGLLLSVGGKWDGTQWVKDAAPGDFWRVDLAHAFTAGMGVFFGKDTTDSVVPATEVQGNLAYTTGVQMTGLPTNGTILPALTLRQDLGANYLNTFSPSSPFYNYLTPYNIVQACARIDVTSGAPPTVTLQQSFNIASAVPSAGNLTVNLSDALHSSFRSMALAVFNTGGLSGTGLTGVALLKPLILGDSQLTIELWDTADGTDISMEDTSIGFSLIVLGRWA